MAYLNEKGLSLLWAQIINMVNEKIKENTDEVLSETSTNPVQNKVITSAINNITLENLGVIYSSQQPAYIEGGIWLKPINGGN